MNRSSYLSFMVFTGLMYSLTTLSANNFLVCQIPSERPQVLSEAKNLNPIVLSLAFKAHDCAQQFGIPINKQVLTIIDYSLPSVDKRMWVIDLQKQQVVMNLLVAHGKNSGYILATQFSDRPGSEESSLGLFLTQNTYEGKHGYSMTLRGLEPGFNDKVSSRAVVVHSAPYVSDAYAHEYGRIGRSWGCLAVDRAYSTQLINTIKEGTLVFSYYPEKEWLDNSKFLHCPLRLD